IGFAPAEKPEIVVGAIVEFAREGPYVAPLVTRVIGHYLGVDTTLASKIRIVLPTDTAPHATQILPGIPEEDSMVVPPILPPSMRSWIAIGGVRLGQPAELAKLAVVLMLARWLAERREAPATLRELLPPCLIAGVPTLLVAKQPDLGSAIVFIAILFAMLYWAGTKPSLLVLLGSPVIGLVLAFSTVAWGAWIIVLLALLLWWRPYVWEGRAVMLGNVLMGVVAVPFWGRLAPYQQNRLLAFLNPEVDPRATGWHVIQSKIAIGSGGLLGQGFTHGPQKRLAFLPAQHTDFIFPVVGEELGFVGVLIALVLLMALILILLRIARRATDPYSSLCVFGVAGLLFTHIIENVGMTVNLLPITGIPLPFFSYGGSFLLACSIAVGISLRVAWESRQSGYAEL